MKNEITKLARESFQEIRDEMIGIARELWSLAEIGKHEKESSSLLTDWC